MAIGLITYMDSVRKEDVVDVVTNISPGETPLLTGLSESADAQNTLHEYLTATLAAAAVNGQVESVDHTLVDLTQPTRLTNKTQIFSKDITVSGTEQVVANYAGNPLDYQTVLKMKELARDIELALMAGSCNTSGASGSARYLAGVINGISTNATTRNSGSSLGETDFNNIMNMIWLGTSQVADEVYVGGTLKRDISAFTAGNTKYVQADAARLYNPVSVYESDFGVHKIMLHRNVPNGANAKMLVAIRNEYWKKAWLTGRRPKVTDIAKSGDSSKKQIIAELTLENRAEAASAAVGGFTS